MGIINVTPDSFSDGGETPDTGSAVTRGRAMAEAGTVAVLLPAASYFSQETVRPDVAMLRWEPRPLATNTSRWPAFFHRWRACCSEAGVRMALATNCNPGSAPCSSLLLCLNLACTLFGLTPEEALAGVTRNAAAALGLQDEIGTLEVGKVADLCVWEVEELPELAYHLGLNRLSMCFRGGVERTSGTGQRPRL